MFTGQLVGVDGPPRALTWSSMDPVTYHFDVDRVLKGEVPRDARVHSVVSGASCGLEGMHQGRRYTVFAREQEGTLHSGLCDGTHEGEPDRSIAFLAGVLLSPTPQGVAMGALLAIGTAVVIAAAAWKLRRRARPQAS